MGIFEKESSNFQNRNYREHLNRNWEAGNDAFDMMTQRIAKKGTQGADEVSLARVDVHGKEYHTLPGRLDDIQGTAESAYKIAVSKADKNVIEEKLSQMSLVPETFENLVELKNKYPNGATGLFVTADTGHKWIFSNGQWKDAGFLQTGLADRSVSPKFIDKVSFANIDNSAFDWKSATSWTAGKFSVNNDGSIDLTSSFDISTNGDSGIIVSGLIDQLNDDFYINIDGVPTKSDNKRPIEIYLMDALGQNFLRGSLMSLSTSTEFKNTIKLNKTELAKDGITSKIYLLVAVHAGDSVKFKMSLSNETYITNMTDIADRVVNADKLETAKIRSEWLETWNDGKHENILTHDENSIYFKQNSNGDAGFILANEIDNSRDVYVTLNIRTTSNVSVYFTDEKLTIVGRQLSDQFNTDGKYKIISYKIPKDQVKNKNIGARPKLLVATHKKGAVVHIKDVNVSNSAGDSKVTQKITDLFEEVGGVSNVVIGNVDALQGTSEIEKVHLVSDNSSVELEGQAIKRITVLVSKAGELNFYVGTVDQYGLLVDSQKYILNAQNVGVNTFAVNIPINKGQRLFLDISNGVAEIFAQTKLFEKCLVQDENHISDVTGYSGMSFYTADYAVPFEYVYGAKPQNQAIEEHEKKINSLETVVEDLKVKSDKVLVTNSKGEKFKLKVSNEGELQITSLLPKKVAIFGNSLTKERGGIGMCATDQFHDYYHYVTEYIKTKNATAKINDRLNVAEWESATTTEDRDAVFERLMKPVLSSDTDLVILQVTDNVNTDAKKATYAIDTKHLLENILSVSPKATILWVVGWFGSQDLFDIVKNSCDQMGATFINVKDLNTSENRGRLGETITGVDGTTWTVTNPGAAAHPGDAGMKAIADRVIANFDF